MLRSGIGDNLPVVDAFLESNISEEISKYIVFFIDKEMSPIGTYFNLFIDFLGSLFNKFLDDADVPGELGDDYTSDLPHLTLLNHTHTFLAKFLSHTWS